MRINWLPCSILTGSYGQIPIRYALAAGFCLAAPILLSSPATAQPNPIVNGSQINLNKTINGASPAGSGPWMSLLVTDFTDGVKEGVSIVFKPTLAVGEFITKVGLSLTPVPNSRPNPFAGLEVKCVYQTPGASICSNYSYVAQVDGYSIEGAAVDGFDLGFNFTGTGQNGGSGRLTNGKTVQFNLTGTDPALTAADLLGTINIKGFDVNAAAKVQGIQNGGSGVVADPEGTSTSVPGPLPILGVAAAFRTSRRLRRRLASARLTSARPPAHRPT